MIIDTDNLKLDKNGKLTMSGNLTSETTTDRAYVGDGIIQLSKKVSGSWQDVAKIWADSSDTGMGHLRLFGDSSNTMVDMWANQGSSFLGLYNKNGSHIFKVYGESRSGWAGEGHLEIGGVNGKGILECKYLIIDGHRVALKRVNYKNQEGTSTWEYLLTANLQDDVIAAVNSSAMPLAVKGIVLENTLLRVKVQLKEEEAAQAQAAALAPEPADTMEATEAPAEQAAEEGADNG